MADINISVGADLKQFTGEIGKIKPINLDVNAKGLDSSTKKVSELGKRAEETGKSLSSKLTAGLDSTIQKISKGLDSTIQKISELGKSLEEVGKRAEEVGKSLSLKLTAPLVALGGLATGVFVGFDDQMRKVQALSGATGEDLEKLTNKAKELGSTTSFSAKEAAQGLEFMALAGFNTEQSIEAIPSVLNLAAAGALELGRAADIVTDSLTPFGLAAEEASRVSDVFATVQSKSNTNVEQLGEALKNVAPNANAFGASIETTSTLLGKLADAGIKGGAAGTGLNAVLRDLKKSADDGVISINGQAVAIANADGSYRDLIDIIGDVNTATEGLSASARDQALGDIFGDESLKSANILLQQGSGNLNELRDALLNSEGAAQRTAETMNAGLGGSLRSLKSATEGVLISIGETLAPTIQKLAVFATQLSLKFNELSEGSKTFIVAVGGIVSAIGPGLVIFGKLVKFLPSLVSGVNLLKVALSGLGKTKVFLILGLIATAVASMKAEFDLLGFVMKPIKAIFEALQPVIDALNEVFEALKEPLRVVAGVLSTLLKAILKPLMPVINVILDIFVQLLKVAIIPLTVQIKIFSAIFEALTPVIIIVANLIEKLANFLSGILGQALEFIISLIKPFLDGLKKISELASFFGVKKSVEEVKEEVKEFKEEVEEVDSKPIETLDNNIKAVGSSTQKTKEEIKDLSKILKRELSTALTGIEDFSIEFRLEEQDQLINDLNDVRNESDKVLKDLEDKRIKLLTEFEISGDRELLKDVENLNKEIINRTIETSKKANIDRESLQKIFTQRLNQIEVEGLEKVEKEREAKAKERQKEIEKQNDRIIKEAKKLRDILIENQSAGSQDIIELIQLEGQAKLTQLQDNFEREIKEYEGNLEIQSELFKKYQRERLNIQAETDAKIVESSKTTFERITEDIQKSLQASLTEVFNFSSLIANNDAVNKSLEGIKKTYEDDAQALRDSLRNKEISQKEYNEQLAKLEQKRNEDEKKAGEDRVSIQEALGKQLALATFKAVEAQIPALATLILGKELSSKGFLGIASTAILTGLLYSSLSIARSALGFEKGGIDINENTKSKRGKSDTIPAWLSAGESVITSLGTKRNKKILELANKGVDVEKYLEMKNISVQQPAYNDYTKVVRSIDYTNERLASIEKIMKKQNTTVNVINKVDRL